ncbi:potassium transporter TrkG [Pararhodobacter aggregans]|uniref:Potassium transporter TrkH n=1 Tax=Pararhodobacter aggregans TaxID=404875 RepID=A0A2T7UVX3_9RHOB|nr:potassium transporter TrkG [Pararhodobacter aggregans]PTX03782.1 trk system potassium uptake protein TrkH [Pararhodobacter aggregans]PVE48731.1 potassium transporter TrkH [Pararhodobacter aggregans]
MPLRLTRVPPLVALIALAGALMLVPAGKAAMDGQASLARVFLYWSVLSLLIASLVAIAMAGQTRRGMPAGPFPLLAAIYLLLPAVMALPLAEALPAMRFADAWFEMISAFTTTGASLIDLPRRVPEAVHLWRGMAGWLGGLFILAAATALLAPLRLGGYEMIRRTPPTLPRAGSTTGPGIRLRAHTLLLLPAYSGLTLALWLILTLVGVSGFEALMQSMATLSTSGVLARETLGSIGLPAEMAIFAFLCLALSRRFLPGHGSRPRPLYRDPEILTAVALVGLVTLFVVARHWAGAFEAREGENLPAMGRAAWGAAFTSLSFLTTTGFVNQDWITARAWSGLTPPGLVLMSVALLGGGVATTAGGIKLLRLYSLARLSRFELMRMIYPSMVIGGNEHDRFLATTAARSAWLFAMVFALTSVVVVALLLFSGMTLETAMIFGVSALTNTGQLVQVAGDLPLYWVLLGDPARVVLALAMILGRLEILVLLAAILDRSRRN